MNMIFASLLLICSLGSQAQSLSGGGGNGGDFIRMKFIEVGNFVLKNYKDGLKEIGPVVTLQDLRSTLDIRVIKLSGSPLFDNGGSKVDALGELGSILLYEGDSERKTGWYGIFSKAELVEKLVLHEMLRAVGVDDDNYIYSSIVLEKYDLNRYDSNAYIHWCSESASFIDSALRQGLHAKTYKQELGIYQKALNQIESLISPKHFFFISPSVAGALKIVPLLKTDKSKAVFLKVVLGQLSSDIRYVDTQLKSKKSESTNLLGDHSKYALSYIQSAARFTIYSETAEIEEHILNIVFDQVYAYMINSDYAWTKYAAVFSEIDSARHTPVLAYKRKALKYLANLLK